MMSERITVREPSGFVAAAETTAEGSGDTLHDTALFGPVPEMEAACKALEAAGHDVVGPQVLHMFAEDAPSAVALVRSRRPLDVPAGLRRTNLDLVERIVGRIA